MIQSPPPSDEIEISVFGPGFGESIVAHIGGGEWIVVDSCRSNGSILPLEYLKQLQVPLDSAVRVVLATHWHNDHIRGLAQIVEQAASAQFYCSQALGSKELSTLTEIWDETDHKASPAFEFLKIQQTLEAAGRSMDFASAHKTLWNRNGAEVIALSPSGDSIHRAYQSIASLVNEVAQTRGRSWAPSPNYNSVALWLRVGSVDVLLGADLEETSPCRGWSVLLDSPVPVPGKASAYKISHHGSHTGDHPAVWSQLLLPAPFAICTPFEKGRVRLPTGADVTRTLQYTPAAFITSVPHDYSRRRRTGTVNRTMLEATRSLKDMNHQPGHVRLRRKIDASAPWNVELFGGARLLNANEFN